MANGFDASKVGGMVQPAVNGAAVAAKKAQTAGQIKKISVKLKFKNKDRDKAK